MNVKCTRGGKRNTENWPRIKILCDITVFRRRWLVLLLAASGTDFDRCLFCQHYLMLPTVTANKSRYCLFRLQFVDRMKA